jgi:glutamyl-tRNA reductase
MTQYPGESYEQWVKRVEQYEYGRALMKLAHGTDPEQVLEDFGRRLVNKLLHPILKAINSVESDHDPAAEKAQYKANYQDRFGLNPDHLTD